MKAGARRCRAEAAASAGTDHDLWTVVMAGLNSVGATTSAVDPAYPLLGGGEARLDRESDDDPVVWYRDDVSREVALFLLAHELAHIHLHTGSFTCFTGDFDPEASEEDMNADRAEPYSPHERRERQANVWAREFLLPAPLLRAKHLDSPVTAAALAAEFGLGERLVRRQLARALLTLEPETGPAAERPLDELRGRQREAARAARGPVLVMAGPGTGKTSTLAGRIAYLVQEVGLPPEDIVALTFSRKAAEEMRARIALASPTAAEAVFIDTVHAFCYDLLVRHGPWPKATVLDGARSMGVLETLLPELPLRHFLYLPDLTGRLGVVLNAISRAKDDLVTPERYASEAQVYLDDALAQEMAARGEKARRTAAEIRVRAERAQEAAAVYAHYQARLDTLRRYDFGDLVMQAVLMLEDDESLLQEVRGKRHFLVDEFQDLNIAANRLVRLLAGSGERLWAVGDPHQAIYRFRGASTSGILGFARDYDGAIPITLDRNYRSLAELIGVFRAMPAHMRAAPSPDPAWLAARRGTGQVSMAVAESPEAEMRGLASRIRSLAPNIPYRNQAVLARTHGHLSQIADALEAADIPVLFLAGFFERDTVRDLLSLVELSCEQSGRGLLRVSSFPEYDVPCDDALGLLALAREQGTTFPAALKLIAEVPGLSERGRAGLTLLRAHLDGVHPGVPPGDFLSDYLFNRSRYLEAYPADDGTPRPVLNQRRRVAIFQLLEIAHAYSLEGKSSRDTKWTFLEYVRRLAAAGEHRQLAQVPEWAASIDAVRLLTVHGSKGLEFDAVHLPLLNLWDFHSGDYLGERRPLPPGLLGDDPETSHYAEEEGVFFVAASRARDVLSLSRSEVRRNSKGEIRPAEPFPLLQAIAPVLPSDPAATPTWMGAPVAPRLPDMAWLEEPPDIPFADIEAYLECPRRFSYERVLGLDGKTSTTPYRKLVSCVSRVVREVVSGARAGAPLAWTDAEDKFRGLWATAGDPGHPYAWLYLEEGLRRVETAVRLASANGAVAYDEFVLTRPKGRVKVVPDLVVGRGRRGVSVQRWTAGEIGWFEMQRPLYAALEAAARETLGVDHVTVEAVSVAAGVVVEVRPRQDGLTRVDAALDGLWRHEYLPTPDAGNCPRCPYYFICPSEGAMG